MSNVHTLKDIEDRGAVGGLLGKQIPPGRRLGSIHESELEKALRGSIKSASDIANDYKDLQDIYLEQVKDFNRICLGFNNKFSQLNTANTELKAKYSAEVKSLKSNIKTLKREATLAQKASSADKVKILSLEVKIRELEGKLEDIDLEHTYHGLDVMEGTIEEPAQINSSEIDSLRLELDRVKEDLNSKEYTIECMEKGKEVSDNIYKRELDIWSSKRLKMMEKNSAFRNQLALKKEPRDASHNEVDTPPHL
ncbi:hypothetical protein C1646_768588 [Rhizophagus diaphanus]|nr:hypothetical protein C1646_768588 [Rhizophagus diaphanus] [Rhizophagus sp. MUCL 43196]